MKIFFDAPKIYFWHQKINVWPPPKIIFNLKNKFFKHMTKKEVELEPKMVKNYKKWLFKIAFFTAFPLKRENNYPT